MKIKELIEKLNAYPNDAIIKYEYDSDFANVVNIYEFYDERTNENCVILN